MFATYFRFFLRLISNNIYYYVLTWIGLVTAIATSTYIFGYTRFENSFDKLHFRSDDLYRVHFTIHKDGTLESVNANSTPLIGPLLFNELEGVEDFSRLYPRSGSTVQVFNENEEILIYPEDKIYHADSSFFRMFNYPLLSGNKNEILQEPFRALLSRSFAIKTFGSIQSAIGKTFKLSEEETYTIEGIFEDLPMNTHLEFEVLLSFSTLEILDWTRESIRTDWGWYSHYNFILLNESRSTESINEEILTITKPHTKTIDERINGSLTYSIFPVKDIYLESDLFGEMDRKGNGFIVRFMGIIAVLILVLVTINYLGMTASISLNRIKETGLRKVLGSDRKNLLMSFILESFLHLTFTFLLAICLLLVIWNHLPVVTGKVIPISILITFDFAIIAILSITLLSLLCGIYHYLLVTKLNLVSALKGADSPGKSSYLFRKSILFIQYLSGVSLLILTMVVYQQVNLLTETDPGFDHKNTLAIKLRRTRGDDQYFRKIDNFSKALTNISGIQQVALSSHIPSEEISWTSGGKIVGQSTTVKFHFYAINERFVNLYDMEIIAGSGYSENIPRNQRSIIINERGARLLGFENSSDAVSKTFLHGGRTEDPYIIIGVVKDHYQRGHKYQVDPMVFHYLPDHSIYTGSTYASLKMDTSVPLTQLLDRLKELWSTHFGGLAIEFSDVDQKYLEQYKDDQRASELLTFFTVIAIMVAIFGLIGIIAFTTKQRVKEIGIRKVLGASLNQILFHLSKSYLFIMCLAILFAWFISYFILETWLQQYPQRVGIDYMIFLLAAILILFISIGIIIFQSLKSGMKNPTEALRAD